MLICSSLIVCLSWKQLLCGQKTAQWEWWVWPKWLCCYLLLCCYFHRYESCRNFAHFTEGRLILQCDPRISYLSWTGNYCAHCMLWVTFAVNLLWALVILIQCLYICVFISWYALAWNSSESQKRCEEVREVSDNDTPFVTVFRPLPTSGKSMQTHTKTWCFTCNDSHLQGCFILKAPPCLSPVL